MDHLLRATAARYSTPTAHPHRLQLQERSVVCSFPRDFPQVPPKEAALYFRRYASRNYARWGANTRPSATPTITRHRLHVAVTPRTSPLSSVAALASPLPLSSFLRGAHFAPPSMTTRVASDASQVVLRPCSLSASEHENVYLSAIVLRVKKLHASCASFTTARAGHASDDATFEAVRA